MITDLAKLEAKDRTAAVQTVADFLKQRRALDDPWEKFSSLELSEMDAAVTASDNAASKAPPAQRPRLLMHLAFDAALRRDSHYALAGRRGLAAQSMQQAMLRSYFAGRVTVLYPIK